MFKTKIVADDEFVSEAQSELIQIKIDEMVGDSKTDGGLEIVPGDGGKSTYIRQWASAEHAQEFIDFLDANLSVVGPHDSVTIVEE